LKERKESNKEGEKKERKKERKKMGENISLVHVIRNSKLKCHHVML